MKVLFSHFEKSNQSGGDMLKSYKKFLPLALIGVGFTALPAQSEELRLTYARPNAVYWDIDVAIEKGFFKEEGFETKSIRLQSSVGSTQALIAGTTNVAATNPEPIITSFEKGATDNAIFLAPVTTIAWSFVGNKDIKTFADLKGKRVGVSALKGGETGLIELLAEKHGLKRSDFSYIRVGITPLKFKALSSGAIGAAVLFQPTGLLAISTGMNNLANFLELTTYQYPVYAVNRKWAMEKDRGARLARAIIKAQKFIQDPANKAEAMKILAKYTRKSPAIVEATYDLFLNKARMYSHNGRIDKAGLNRLIGIMLKSKTLKSKPSGSVDKYILSLEKVGYKD
jgi:NitT/TauT family transport system substrate-binding protein